ncbi:MAG: hypothetical protein AB7P01_00240 [Bacteroidia bacterium]
MKAIDSIVRESFSKELKDKGDVWRILRRGSFVDLIRVSFFDYQKDNDKKQLVDIINYCMKAKLLSKIKSIEVKDTLEGTREGFNKEDEFILKQYDEVFNALRPRFAAYSSTDRYDLSNKMLYIKVINQLELDSYSDDVFDEIIGITYTILLKEG